MHRFRGWRPWRTLVLIASLAGMAAGLASPATQAKTITYRDLSHWHVDVRAAMSLWSSSGADVRFVKAHGRRPDIIFKDHHFGLTDPASGRWSPPYVLLGTYATHEPGDPRLHDQTFTAAHEIGHALGLGHATGCSLMWATNVSDAMYRLCHQPKTRVPCGPQRRDVRLVARRYGWRPGGRRALRRPGFGLCDYAAGPVGALPTASLCQPATLTVPRSSTETTQLSLRQAFVDNVVFAGQETCTWGTSRAQVTVIIDAWHPGSSDRASDPLRPSGNCTGKRRDTATRIYSLSRYLTVRLDTWGAHLPDADAAALLRPILERAEQAGVGAECAGSGGVTAGGAG